MTITSCPATTSRDGGWFTSRRSAFGRGGSGSAPTYRIPALLCLAVLATGASAAEDIRLVPQLLFGTAGIEPGLALEWRSWDMSPLVIRPEGLVSEDGRLGGGAALLYDLAPSVGLSRRTALAIGPRAVYHHADDYGWEVGGLATLGYTLDGATGQSGHHVVGLLGAVGAVHDLRHDEADVGVTGGLFYAYRL